MILIAFGANLASVAGAPQATLRAALDAIGGRVAVESCSALYGSPAWPDPSDPPFVNAVARIRTSLSPEALLKLLHDVEAEFGRTRGVRNAPRTLDLDLIDYNGRVQSGPPELPHPRVAERGFVLVPLRDVAPEWRHPVSGRTLSELLAAMPHDEITPLGPL